MHGENSRDTLHCMMKVATARTRQCKFKEAEVLYNECLAKSKVVLSKNDSLTLDLMDNFASNYILSEKYSEAENLLNITYQRRLVLGADDPGTITTMASLATVYNSQNRYSDAEILQKQCLGYHYNHIITTTTTTTNIINITRENEGCVWCNRS